jgi:cation:H+ antiporter
MLGEILRWIGDEALLHELVKGLPTIGLLGIIAVCILLLSKGADWMIDGVVGLARRTGLPRIVIGATIVSFWATGSDPLLRIRD